MLRRPLSLGLLVTLAVAAPAAAHGGSAPFPTLKASAGTSTRAQVLERRVRRVETQFLGPGHAAEHAQERAAARALIRERKRQAYNPPLENDNTLQPYHVGGRWKDGEHLPIVAINSTLMRDGKVFIYAYPWRAHELAPKTGVPLSDPNRADAYIFDPDTGDYTEVPPPIDPATGKPYNIFCSGTSLLPDGRVLVTGGNIGDPTVQPNHGLPIVLAFDPVSETWTQFQNMRQGRWYPTQTEMSDGRTLVIAGAPGAVDPDWTGNRQYGINTDADIVSPDGTVQTLKNFKLDLGDDGSVADDGPGVTHAPFPGQYPHVWWMPSGHALVAGPRKTDTWRFFPPTPGADDASWTDTADIPTYREWAAGALLPGTTAADATQVMLFGGALSRNDHYSPVTGDNFDSSATTAVFDDATDQWTTGPSMHVARAFANSVLLPNGQIAVVGGGKGEFNGQKDYRWQYFEGDKRIDLYDPSTKKFTFGNAQAEGRTYHSTALLLPDGTVMSAGDDINGPTGPGSGVITDTAEIWRPPYLYDADDQPAVRPVIDAAPKTIEYGKPFAVSVSGKAATAVLVAPGADTHDNDMSQRLVPLATPADAGGGAYNLVAPATADEAPPGYYMVFVLNAAGVPAKAEFVQLKQPSAVVTPTPTPTDSPTVDPSTTPTVTPSMTPTVTPTVTPTPGFKVSISVTAPTLKRLVRTGSLPVHVALSGAAAKVTVRARVQVGSRLRPLVAPQTQTYFKPRTRRFALKVSHAGAKRIAKDKRAVLQLTAAAIPVGPGVAASTTKRLVLR